MKRSDIINIIESFDYHERGTYGEEILQALEQAGMQPPAIKEPCETYVLYNGQYLKTEDSFVFTSKWEPEDGRE